MHRHQATAVDVEGWSGAAVTDWLTGRVGTVGAVGVAASIAPGVAGIVTAIAFGCGWLASMATVAHWPDGATGVGAETGGGCTGAGCLATAGTGGGVAATGGRLGGDGVMAGAAAH